MVVDRLIVDVDAQGRVRVLAAPVGVDPEPVAGPVGLLEWPLGGGELERLRWHVEDYLRAPFGVYADDWSSG